MNHPERDAVTTSLPETETLRDTPAPVPGPAGVPVFDAKNVSIYYGSFRAVTDVSPTINQHEITAFIGSSGSGKSTVLRAFNRMNDLVPDARMSGEIYYRGASPCGPGIRRKSELDEIVERSLRQAALWEEVRNRLGKSALGLSGGQAQRLCIARTIAVEPDVVLMDEPASALDPIATGKIEDLMQDLKSRYTIVIVTHNMQQATRVSDRTAFFSVLTDSETDTRTGVLVEYGPTSQIFGNPRDARTQAYVTGRVG
jgi:phosphate transport system ATP-binding protein